jgi:thioredoxin 1
VNVDENPTSAIRFNIQWIPTVMIFKNWQPIQILVGVRPPEEYQAIFNQILNENWWNNQETTDQKKNIIEVNWTAEFNQTIENNKDKLLIVDFWAPWCGPCRMIAPVLEQIAKDFWDKVLIVKVNVDQPQNQMLAMQYQVSSIPHVEFIKWGMTVNRIIGAYPYEEFKKIVQQYV